MPKYWLPWLVGMPAEQSRAACCLIFGGVLERLPELKVCFAHGGGSFGFRVRPRCEGRPHVAWIGHATDRVAKLRRRRERRVPGASPSGPPSNSSRGQHQRDTPGANTNGDVASERLG